MAESAALRAIDVRDLRVLATAGGGGIGRALDQAFAAASARVHSFEETEAAYLAKISLRRMAEADDVADLALFLASGLARNIAGQAISMDGHVEYL